MRFRGERVVVDVRSPSTSRRELSAWLLIDLLLFEHIELSVIYLTHLAFFGFGGRGRADGFVVIVVAAAGSGIGFGVVCWRRRRADVVVTLVCRCSRGRRRRTDLVVAVGHFGRSDGAVSTAKEF